MDLNEYPELAYRTDRHDKITQVPTPVILALALQSEVGELSGKLYKLYRDMDGETTDEYTRAMLRECGDILWDLTAVIRSLGSNLNSVAAANIDKLSKRLATGTIHGNGDDREEK